jgi:hypothetical protein
MIWRARRLCPEAPIAGAVRNLNWSQVRTTRRRAGKMMHLEELFKGSANETTADRDEDIVDEEIDLDSEDWFGSIDVDRGTDATRPRSAP